MRCIFCDFFDTKVVDSRSADDGKAIRRRRECSKCGKRFTTYEKVENLPLIIVKKDGRREMFEPTKILNGLIKACEKRPVALQDLEKVCAEIERDLNNKMDREIDSSLIGELVMEKLKILDEVSYVRFASVYREFKDINTFINEIELLIQKQK
ncbi:transcriptional repressor NrdR [Desulfonispora thiosulfatigenes DSM 11270]|uniref:Transcriptional repressor NrdR n=1 Tax=Desulfonispora thiosulfatigenes DSM 11270 TaxID=656914 RepID=A0A1W1VTH1_DESTI|nr:transcriptional regulator NrdR [Desulfonispora thiosulfatigenes]SMB96401.1 transcriptional repressor NrdR [Desulfonispora thiosulfatigenes DSM 11270]